MWNPAEIIAVATAATSLLGAAAVFVAQLRHQSDPAAHGGIGHPAVPGPVASPGAPPAPSGLD